MAGYPITALDDLVRQRDAALARVAALTAALEQVRTCECDLCGACQAALDAAGGTP